MLDKAASRGIEFLQQHSNVNLRETLKIRRFSLTRIPLLFLLRPDVIRMDDEACEIRIKLNALTKNHYGSMYFGVLACGADLGAGAFAQNWIDQVAPGQVQLLFKNFQAHFLKRAEGDVHFICTDIEKVRHCVEAALETGERQNAPIQIVATVPKIDSEPVAKFVLTLSLKAKK